MPRDEGRARPDQFDHARFSTEVFPLVDVVIQDGHDSRVISRVVGRFGMGAELVEEDVVVDEAESGSEIREASGGQVVDRQKVLSGDLGRLEREEVLGSEVQVGPPREEQRNVTAPVLRGGVFFARKVGVGECTGQRVEICSLSGSAYVV